LVVVKFDPPAPCAEPPGVRRWDMPKRSSKAKTQTRDENQAAYDAVQHVIRETEGPTVPEKPEKNPAAVALGRLGGLKGGKARAKKRAKKLSARKRSEARRGAGRGARR